MIYIYFEKLNLDDPITKKKERVLFLLCCVPSNSESLEPRLVPLVI